MQYVWFTWSVILLGIWGLIFFLNPSVRREMLWASVWTAPLGLTEPLFVPEYWDPPSLFDLAQKTGFDIESILFSFGIGGIAAVLYEFVFKVKHLPVNAHERHQPRHRFHRLILFFPVIIFLILAMFTGWNHIYCTIVALFVGALLTLFCRPDLKSKIWIGGFLFLGLYFIYFYSLILFFPDYVEHVWNLNEISGVLIAGIPLEEYLFAFTLGMLWSSLYEHIFWIKLQKQL